VASANISHDMWIGVGMALKDLFGDNEGFNLWDGWSRTCRARYQHSIMQSKWRSFHGRGITIATLFKLADDSDTSWRDQFKPKSPGSHLPGANTSLRQMLDECDAEPLATEEVDAAYAAEAEWIRTLEDEPARAASDNTTTEEDEPVEGATTSAPDAFGDASASREPFDLFGSLTPEPVMTRDMLPRKIGDYVWEMSDLLGCDPGAMAVSALALCSGLISDQIKLQPKRLDTTYLEVARIWLMLVGSVSAKKTPMFLKLFPTVKAVENRMRREDATAIEKYKSLLALYELKKKGWDKKVAVNEVEASSWPPEKPEKPPRRRLIANDYTVEALALVLCDNPRGLLIELDEIMELFGGFDAYKASGVKKDRSATLRLWNGGYQAIDRVRTTDEPIYVPNWGATIIGGIQHTKLDPIGPKLVDDGLLQRFLMVPIQQAEKEADRLPDPAIVERYSLLVESLIEFNPPDAVIVKLSEAAHAYRDRIEDLIRALECLPALSEGFRTHAGKMGAIFARLVLTLHVIERAPLYEDDEDGGVGGFKMIEESTARRAYDLMVTFLIPHAVRQYARISANGGDEGNEDARWLAGHILARSVEKVNVRVCQNAHRGFKKDQKRATKAIGILIEAKWIGTDGTVNPLVHEMFAERAAAERQTRDARIDRIRRSEAVVKQNYP
jgi:hypothetical protein